MRERLPMRTFWACGLGLLAVQLLLRLWFMKDGFFWQDDFSYLKDVRDGLSFPVAFQSYNGHLMPGTFFLSWIISVLGSSWGITVCLLLVLQLVAGASLLWVTGRLFGGHPAALVIYALGIFSPLTLVGSMWFAYGLQLWPQQIAVCVALGCYLRYRQTGAARWVIGVLGALVAGLFFWEKGALILPVLLLFSVLVLDRGSPWRHRLTTVRSEWRLWLPMLTITAGYTVLYLTLASQATTRDNGSSPVTVINNALMRTLLPGLLGGPWTKTGSIFTISAMPNDVVTVVVALLWLAVIGGSFLWRGRRAGAAWLWALLAIAANYALLLLFRPDADTLVRDTRYIADIVPVIALAVGLAFLAPQSSTDAVPPGSHTARLDTVDSPATANGASLGQALASIPLRLTAGVAMFLAACLFASAWVSTRVLAPDMQHSLSRAFVNALRLSSQADADRPILQRAAPNPNVYYGSQQDLADGLGIRTHWVYAGRDLLMFDDQGRLGGVSVLAPKWRKAGPLKGCGWLVKPGSPGHIDLGDQKPAYNTVLTLGVLSGGDYAIRLRFDNGYTVVTSTGPNRLAVLTVTLDFPAHNVTVLTPDSGSGACITDAAIGAPGVRASVQ